MFSAKTDIWFRSIRVRLAALFVTIFGSVLIAFSAVLYNTFVQTELNELDVALYNHAVDVSANVNINLFGELYIGSDMLSTGAKIFPFAVGKTFVQILNPSGKVLARSRALGKGQLPVFKDEWNALPKRGAVFRTISRRDLPEGSAAEKGSYRLLTFLVRDRPGENFVLQLAVPMTFMEQSARGLYTFILIAIPLTLVIAALGGLYWSRRALAPVTAIINKARNISPGQLSERVPVPRADDELRQLSLTLNALLDRLERAFRSQERFVSDASHELKTPLAILRGELDLMASRCRSPEEISLTLTSASQELDHLSRMVEDLLLLARVDGGAGTLSLQQVRLDELVLETASRLEPFARPRAIRIRADLENSDSADFDILGDPDLLRVLLKNLVENAIKFSPDGSVVEVLVGGGSDFAEVQVRDHGPGIPEESIPRVFERFYRAAAGATGAALVQGSGLGLAIARRIAEAHRGAIEVESRPGAGATFTLRVPRH